MMGEHGDGGLLILVARKSRCIRVERVVSKQADHVADVLFGAFAPLKKRIHTLTMDNGNELSQHKKVAKALQANVYFAQTYCAWKRGLN